MSDPVNIRAEDPSSGSPAPNGHRTGLWSFVAGAGLILLAALCFAKVFWGPSQNLILVGVLMIVGGLAEGIHAVFGRNWRDFVSDLAPALLYVLSGMTIMADPQTGSFLLTLVLTAALVTGAVYRVAASWRSRPLTGWQTLGTAVIVSICAWLVLLWSWPTSVLWVLGTVAGCGLAATGIAWIQRGIAARAVPEA